MLRQTHTYAKLEVSPSAFGEIKQRLENVNYHHCIHGDDEGKQMLTMEGIALSPEKEPEEIKLTEEQRKISELVFKYSAGELALMVEDFSTRMAKINALAAGPLPLGFREEVFVLSGGDPKVIAWE